VDLYVRIILLRFPPNNSFRPLSYSGDYMYKRFKVQLSKDSTYEVLEWISKGDYDSDWKSVFSGSLADCEAYIRLREGDYM
jgi:hypothetical protein